MPAMVLASHEKPKDWLPACAGMTVAAHARTPLRHSREGGNLFLVKA